MKTKEALKVLIREKFKDLTKDQLKKILASTKKIKKTSS